MLSQKFWRLNHTFWVFVNQDGNKFSLGNWLFVDRLKSTNLGQVFCRHLLSPRRFKNSRRCVRIAPRFGAKSARELWTTSERIFMAQERFSPWVLREYACRKDGDVFPPTSPDFSLVFLEQKCRRPRTSQKVQPSAADFWMAGTAETPDCFKCFLEDWCVVLISSFFSIFWHFVLDWVHSHDVDRSYRSGLLFIQVKSNPIHIYIY